MYKLTIGLEIHVEMLTKTKMFSAASNDLNAQPNTCINEIDVGLPGAMPSVNKKAVELAIKLAKALNMEIDHVLKFDRKNYFYCDLPKGFQITQFFNPIGKKGFLKVNDQEIKIERIHLEEDTAKQINDGSNILLDYNRAGVPLIEIVTNPDIHSKEECINFLKQLKQLLVFLNISSGKMETGNLRVDLNLSISDSTQLGERVEIKNLNSFNSIANAIDYEYKRQLNLINDKKQIKLETRR
jgi:aspartyl-tRNA(Asn)/glutamyl-tRNA(Gln) amidotransferase subunit B